MEIAWTRSRGRVPALQQLPVPQSHLRGFCPYRISARRSPQWDTCPCQLFNGVGHAAQSRWCGQRTSVQHVLFTGARTGSPDLTALSHTGDRQAAPSALLSRLQDGQASLAGGRWRWRAWCRVSHRDWIWCKEAATEMVSPPQGRAMWTKHILIHMMTVAVVVDGWGVGPFPGIFPTNAQSTKKELMIVSGFRQEALPACVTVCWDQRSDHSCLQLLVIFNF